jgi:phosphate transport system substrate-binding protein
MTMKTFLVAAFTLLASATTLVGQADSKIIIKGSDTLGAKLVPMLKDEFRAQNKDVSFEIAAEGSSQGIAALTAGTAHICMSSRAAKVTEETLASSKGVKLTPTVIAHDGIGIIVNAANPVKKLTRRQVEQIFTGDITDWSAVGGKPGKISIYTRNSSSGTYGDFMQLAMKNRDYAKAAQKMAGNEQIAEEVGNNPLGIGYVGLAYLNARGVRAVAVDGQLPSAETVRKGTYAFSRPTYFYTNGEATGIVGKFVAFAVSPEGQAIAEKVGFVSVAAVPRGK